MGKTNHDIALTRLRKILINGPINDYRHYHVASKIEEAIWDNKSHFENNPEQLKFWTEIQQQNRFVKLTYLCRLFEWSTNSNKALSIPSSLVFIINNHVDLNSTISTWTNQPKNKLCRWIGALPVAGRDNELSWMLWRVKKLRDKALAHNNPNGHNPTPSNLDLIFLASWAKAFLQWIGNAFWNEELTLKDGSPMAPNINDICQQVLTSASEG